VLSDSYEHVTLIERDEFPLRGEGRPGVPQDAQWHAFNPMTGMVLEQLYPGLPAELESAHVPVLHDLGQVFLEIAGHTLCRDGELPMPWHQVTRPLLEAHLRARTSERVLMRPGVTALDLLVTDGRVVGVALSTPDGLENLAADLVVDATGGALTHRADLPQPAESRVDVDVRQVTATIFVQTVPSSVDPLLMLAPHLGRPSGVAVARVGCGVWQVSAMGYRGHHPPVDRDGLLAWAEPLLPPHWWRMLAANEWSEPAVYDFSTSIWRRWDQVAAPPPGLLVVGDALLRLNPMHAKGIFLAACEALVLRDCLAQGDGDLPQRFYGAAGVLIAKEWELTEGPDRLCIEGSVDPQAAAKNDKLLHKLLTLAENDPELVQNLLRVQWGMAEASSLLTPAIVRKLVGSRFRFGRGRSKESVA
jgi:2-polyprenyl-6-methoxyphenol hydroxylase-like FAD-dependent oxidoreductase